MIFGTEPVGEVIGQLVRSKAKRATKYVDPKYVVSAQRVMFQGKLDGRDTRATIVVKLGAPNYLERLFIKACLKAGEPFPVRKVQLKFPAAKKRKKAH